MRSRSRGIQEKIAKSLGYKAFRCREENCGWRGLLRIFTSEAGHYGFWEKRSAKVYFVIMLLVNFTVLIYLLRWGSSLKY